MGLGGWVGFWVRCPAQDPIYTHNHQEGEGVDERDEAPEPQGEPEEDLEGDRGPDDLLEVAPDDGELNQDPQRQGRLAAVLLLADAREVLPGHDAEARGHALEGEAHDVGEEEHPEQAVARVRAHLQVRLDVPGVEEGDAHQEARPRVGDEGPEGEPALRVLWCVCMCV